MLYSCIPSTRSLHERSERLDSLGALQPLVLPLDLRSRAELLLVELDGWRVPLKHAPLDTPAVALERNLADLGEESLANTRPALLRDDEDVLDPETRLAEPRRVVEAVLLSAKMSGDTYDAHGDSLARVEAHDHGVGVLVLEDGLLHHRGRAGDGIGLLLVDGLRLEKGWEHTGQSRQPGSMSQTEERQDMDQCGVYDPRARQFAVVRGRSW